MIARAIEAVFYTSAVNGTHRAMSDMGFIPDGSHGTPAEQVRAAIHGSTVEAIAAPVADEDADKPRTRAKGGAK
jgi:hypothetical protein